MSVPPDQIAQLMKQYPDWQNQLQQYMKTQGGQQNAPAMQAPQGGQQAIPGGIGLGQSSKGIGLGKPMQSFSPGMQNGQRRMELNSRRTERDSQHQARLDKRDAEYRAAHNGQSRPVWVAPWGEGKPWATKEQYDTELEAYKPEAESQNWMAQAMTKYNPFDPSQVGRPEDIARLQNLSPLEIAEMKRTDEFDRAHPSPFGYKTPAAWQQIFDANPNVKSLNSDEEYKAAGYVQQAVPFSEKFGSGGQMRWVQAPQQPPTATPQPTQQAPAGQAPAGQAGMPTTLPAQTPQGQTPKAASGATMPSTQQPPNPKAASGTQLANAMQPPRP
jgi:hypothetical protein